MQTTAILTDLVDWGYYGRVFALQTWYVPARLVKLSRDYCLSLFFSEKTQAKSCSKEDLRTLSVRTLRSLVQTQAFNNLDVRYWRFKHTSNAVNGRSCCGSQGEAHGLKRLLALKHLARRINLHRQISKLTRAQTVWIRCRYAPTSLRDARLAYSQT